MLNGVTPRRRINAKVIALTAFCVNSFVLAGGPAHAAPPTYTATVIEHPFPQEYARFGRALARAGDIDGDGVSDILASARFQDLEGAPPLRPPHRATGVGRLCTGHGPEPGERVPQYNQGQAYVFSGATGSLLLTLDDPEPQWSASFGRAVSAIGDVNDDAVPDLLIGAPFQDVTGVEEQGQAFIFSGANGEVLHVLDNPTPQAYAHHALSVAGVGDIDGDEVPDAIIGTHFQDINGNVDEGISYAYSGADGTLIRTLRDPFPKPYAIFADMVAGTRDINGDLIPDLLVGAPYQSIQGQQLMGRAFVFSGADGSLLRVLDNPFPQTRSLFGTSVSGVGDITGDRVPDIMVGALYQDVGGNADQGQAFVYSGATGALVHVIDNPEPQAGSLFSVWTAGVGDVDGDRVSDLFTGAPEQNVGGNSKQGKAHLYSGATGDLLLTLENPDPVAEAFFGFPTTRAGDLNGDGIPDLLVGASGQSVDGRLQQGRVYVFLSNLP